MLKRNKNLPSISKKNLFEEGFIQSLKSLQKEIDSSGLDDSDVQTFLVMSMGEMFRKFHDDTRKKQFARFFEFF